MTKENLTFEDILTLRRSAGIELSDGIKEKTITDENGKKIIVVSFPKLKAVWDHEIEEKAIELADQLF